ncbi:hypothetical protein EHE19_012930 [Ruminiclostridium herbifermentans]|uniref:Baseplate protein J-like domain-containing protein n=1 Tax=Ruminiclostridium herbifermentans TaxID=2488810 RepID=A0A4U7JI05_9FIRM|nr:hypothetical protein [Ruminiclostridium herbifermentans]QNU65802.1 hypothetical protein EHE19_012930 [Ruminiclostridium herbifermentans]
MSIAIPNLDRMNFEELVKEAKSLIPIYNPEWTNHNPSDPGITLIELFAWLCEMMIYRIDQVPDENYIHFLNLLGIKLNDGEDLLSGIRRGVEQLSECTKAVTAEDFEKLAYEAVMSKPGIKEMFPDISVRAICYKNRDLENNITDDEKFGDISIILITEVSDQMKFLKEHSDLKNYVKDYLHERKLLTNRVHVVDPEYQEIRINMQIAADDLKIADTVKRVIEEYLDPIKGGPDKKGWPLGRNFYSSDLYYLVEGISGVEHVIRLELDSPTLKPHQLVKLKLITIEVES